MKKILLSCLLLSFLLAFKPEKQEGDYHFPAEWEEQEAVWVGIFHRPGRELVSAAIIKSIYLHVQVRLCYAADSTRRRFNKLLSTVQVDTTKLQWIKDSISYNWVRDPGPLFLINKKGQKKVIDFGWNQYGNIYVFNEKLRRTDSIMGRIDKRIAEKYKLPVISTTMVAEGGGIETNGAGVLMSIEETALQRNPGKSLQEIEQEYLRVTACKKMIWLKRMTLHDKSVPGLLVENWISGGANGHIDEAVRFVGPRTIAVAKIDEKERKSNPISQIDYDILEEYCHTIKEARDANGNPFTIIRIPSPDLNPHAISYKMDSAMRKNFPDGVPAVRDGDTIRYVPAVSYMNFMITNAVVLVARYWKEGMPVKEKEKDDQVKQIFEKLFPNRKIVQINPFNINGGGGGIHCATLNEPGKFTTGKIPAINNPVIR